MKDHELIAAVVEMRRLQRAYYACSKDHPDKQPRLQRARAQEGIVDRELARRAAADRTPAFDFEASAQA